MTSRKGEITRGDLKRKWRDDSDFGVFCFSKPAEGSPERFGGIGCPRSANEVAAPYP
jgi:hypothetical protein